LRRFLITSPKFTGTGELWYNFEGMLCRIDLLDTDMNYTQIRYMLNYISPGVDTLAESFAKSGLQIKEAPFELTLEDFKREYPYSRNYHLLDPIWNTLTAKVRVLAWFRAIEYRKYCKRNANWYKPKIAASWLQKKEYLNDWKNL
jgi:hypothetical protein